MHISNIIQIRTLIRLIKYNNNFASDSFLDLLYSPDSYINSANKILKNDATSTVAVVVIDNVPLVIKRSNIRGFFHRLKRLLFKSRAKRAWDNAWKLQEWHINSVTPIALIEQRFGLFKGKSYFVCNYLEGIKAVDIFTGKTELDIAAKNAAIAVWELLSKLRDARVSHNDLNLSNILLVNGKAYLLDLDAMRQHQFAVTADYWHRRDLERFNQNWDEYPGTAAARECYAELTAK